MRRILDFDSLARVGTVLLDEIRGVPETLANAHDGLTRLPAQLTALVAALERTTAALDRAIPELTRAIVAMEARIDHVDRLATELATDLTRAAGSLERVLPEVSNAIGAMDGRLRNLDATISDLGAMVFTLIDIIPGARRVLRRNDAGR